MNFSPKLLFWLMFFATIGQGFTSGAVHLTGLVPAESIPTVTGWIGFTTFCVMSFLTLATGRATVGAGPIARPPTVDEAQKVMQQAVAAQGGHT